MVGQLFADVLGGRVERHELARVFQFRVLALQCLDAFVGFVVEDRDQQRDRVVGSPVVPDARGVIHHPHPERVEMGDQDVRLCAVGFKRELLQHQPRTDLIDVEKVHGRLILALCFLDPQQRTEVGVGDSGQATQVAGTSSGELSPGPDNLGVDRVVVGHGKHPLGVMSPRLLQRFQPLSVTNDHRGTKAPAQLDARIALVVFDNHRSNPRLPEAANKHDPDVFAEAADHDMPAHPGDHHLLQPIAKQQSEGADRGPTGDHRAEVASDVQLPRHVRMFGGIYQEVLEAPVDRVGPMWMRGFIFLGMGQVLPRPDAPKDECRDAGDTKHPPLVSNQQTHEPPHSASERARATGW